MSYTKTDMSLIAKDKVVDPRSNKSKTNGSLFKWWLSDGDLDLCAQVLSTHEYLKKTNMHRIRQASIFTRLFSGKPLYNYFASNSSLDQSNQLPMGRPTANVTYSCIDTIVSRISQDRPKPVFLTDNGHYKERKLAKEANAFIQGEIFRTKAYELGALALRDSCIFGTGFLKVFAKDNKVCVERTLETELLTDFNDAYYDNPTQLLQVKLVDRSVIEARFPKKEKVAEQATHGNVDSTPRSTETISDQIIVVEAWHRRSSENSNDGRHVIVCDHGVLLDEDWDKDHFPFVRITYNPHPVNWYAQGLAEILMPTQMELYRILIVASQSIELMGVPRVLVEEMSKILETSFNNRIGSIIKFRNQKPEFINAQANNPETYQYIQWLISNAYQMSGISAMSATGEKPNGLNSGESIREFDSIQDDRFAALARRYQNIYTDLSYLLIETAQEIEEETGSYTTVYPGKDGTREVDFKHINALKDTYIVQCFEESSLPKDPAGRQAKLSEMLAAGEISNQEFRRLSNFPDLEQSDRLANALEERILSNLDSIIDKGEKGYNPPDQFILDPTDLATTLTVNYINMYSVTDLEDEKMHLLFDYFTAVQVLKQKANPPPALPPPNQPAPGPLPVAPPAPSMAPTSGVQV